MGRRSLSSARSPTSGQQQGGKAARELRKKLGEERLNAVVVGEFKRGKAESIPPPRFRSS